MLETFFELEIISSLARWVLAYASDRLHSLYGNVGVVMPSMPVELGIVGALMPLPLISPPYEGVDEGIDTVDAGAWTAVMLMELLVLLVLFMPVKLPAPVICGIFTGRSAGI